MIELESMAVEMPEVEGHPNRAEFRGVLTVVDVPSQRAPSGSGGHRVVLTRKAAEEALPSLLGMALDFAPSYDRHDARRKVGVITAAEVVGRNLEVGGYFYAKDFPDVVAEVAKFGRGSRVVAGVGRPDRFMQAMVEPGGAGEVARLTASLSAAVEALREVHASASRNKAAGARLGMSFEVTDAVVADRRAKIWTITHVTFTGAAVLRRDKAAFEDTWIELS